MDVKTRAAADRQPARDAKPARAARSGLDDPLRQQQGSGDSLQDPLRGGFGGGAGRAAPAARRLTPGSKIELGDRRAWVSSMDGEVERAAGGKVKFNDSGRLVLRVASGERLLEVVIVGGAGEEVALLPKILAVEAAVAEKEPEAGDAGAE